MTDRHAKIVIIGGGAIGCAIAYHLARLGESDIELVEKAQLTYGSTWHAAGLVGQLRSKKNLTRLMQNSVAVFDELEAAQTIDWRKAGSLRIASSAERMAEIRRALGQAKGFGFEAYEISPHEAKERFPYMSLDGVVGAAWIPSDGYIDPYSLTQAFAKGARAGGARLREGVLVTGFEIAGRRVVAVETNQGRIVCDAVVNCAGVWAKRVGEMAGIALAAGIVEHQYIITERKFDLPKSTPTFRDPDRVFYLKPDVGAFAIGGWEGDAPARWLDGAPDAFGRELFASDVERFEPIMAGAAARIPMLNDVGIKTLINGPIPVSADGEPILGLAPELDNFFVACGFTAGVAASGGAGLAMAHWIVDGDPGMDLWPFDVRRFSEHQANRAYLAARASEAYGRYYAIHYPLDELESARNARRSPLHDKLARRGAVFGSKAGWERPNWFQRSGAEERPSFLDKPGWFDAVAHEHRAVREGVALIDQTSFAKFEVEGQGAFDALQRIAANDLDKPPGACVYTQLCNEAGGIEADLTIMRIAMDRFYIVTGSGFGRRDGNWIRRRLTAGARLRDVTSERAVINLVGPRARDVLASVTRDDVSNADFPYLTVRDIEIGLARVRAARIGYVGELGWELHAPAEYGAHVYETLCEAGSTFGLIDVGYRAMETLRLEKGYVYWSSDVGPDVTPYEAGLGFAVALAKADFIGKPALVAAKAKGPDRRLSTLTVDGFAPLHGGEAVLRNGQVIATTTSAGFGHTVAKTIAYAYLPSRVEANDRYEIEAFGTAFEARRGARALYDPTGARLRS